MKVRIFVAAILLISFLGEQSLAGEPDWQIYDAMLAEHVAPGEIDGVALSRVNYPGLRRDPRFAQVVDQIAGFPLAQLQTREEKLAFYINAYNILAMKMVLDHWPVKSIKDAGGLLSPVWDRPAGVVGGEEVTLGEVEHKILRPMGESRIHMAIVCASVSCPDLRTEAYTAARLDEQLDAQTRHFLGNPAKGLHADGAQIRVSKIFDWFEEDFEASHGDAGLFIRRYVDIPDGASVKANLPYNWSLNGE